MKRIFSSTLLIFGMMLSSCLGQPNPSLSPEKFSEKSKGEKVLLLDVRTPKEYNDGHLKGAVLINYLGNDFTQEVSKLDKSKPVYIYCRSGSRSSDAQGEMLKMGFTNVINLEGGIMAWEKAGLPIEK